MVYNKVVRSLPFLFVLILITGLARAQGPCGAGQKIIPNNAAGVNELLHIREYIAGNQSAKLQGDTLFFPTVVHIIHNGTVGNISDSQVVDGLRIVNEDFNRENPDTSLTRNLFKPYATAIGFKFVLAKLDSNGDSTSGIVRIDTSIIPDPEPTDPDFDNSKKLSHWPPDMYYNIWLVTGIQGGSLGYAQYPGTNFIYGGPWETWGIVVRSDQWGTIGTSNADGRTGTHEVGHTFGLYHTFLSTTAGCGTECDTTGDEVCDTPPNKSSGGCSQLANTCFNDTLGNSVYDSNIVDQVENYMSYNNCQNMFSLGQKVRMRGFIAEFPTIQGLSSDSNLLLTGIIDAIPVGVSEKNEGLNVFTAMPNPFFNSLELTIWTEFPVRPGQIRMINILGQDVDMSVSNITTSGDRHNLTLELDPALQSGLYLLIWDTESGSQTVKLVKK